MGLKRNCGSRRIASNAIGYVHSYLFEGDERRRLFSRLPEFHKTDALRCSGHSIDFWREVSSIFASRQF